MKTTTLISSAVCLLTCVHAMLGLAGCSDRDEKEPAGEGTQAETKHAPNEAAKPSIVFMMADNLGYGDLGCYGGGEMRGMSTPNIDRLAGESMRFTQFLVEPDSAASRAATMTGRYAIRCGLSLRGTVGALADEEYTLAEMLKDVGYSTAYLGKWHLGIERQPQHHGFDRFYGVLNSDGIWKAVEERKLALTVRILSGYLWKGTAGKSGSLVSEYHGHAAEMDGIIAYDAVKHIKDTARKDSPFFLFISWSSPGFLGQPTEAFEGKSRIGSYGDIVMELDHNTGRVLDAIKAAGIEEDTIVVWMSGNGPELPSWEDGGSTGPFRGEMGDAREGSIRTAAMIKWPGKIKPGADYGMLSTMDLFPTLASFVGGRMKTDLPIDGIDQSAWLLGKQKKSNRESLITFIGDDPVAVRWRQFRCYSRGFVQKEGDSAGVEGTDKNRKDHPIIYNIEADPTEEEDVDPDSEVAGQYMRVIEEYRASLKKHPNTSAASRLKDP